ncbi:hypothetical protein FOA52_002967 [Chlamydomonas sp. UWO 241]|nr:hypothetical protein FOA52_002967 [Chlamydomonas sp. UWO 241]
MTALTRPVAMESEVQGGAAAAVADAGATEAPRGGGSSGGGSSGSGGGSSGGGSGSSGGGGDSSGVATAAIAAAGAAEGPRGGRGVGTGRRFFRRDEYEALRSALALPFGTAVDVGALQARFAGVRTETLISIYAQEQQYKVIRSNHLHKNRIMEYWAWYLAGEDVLSICAAVDFPPCMLMRRMLESALKVNKQAIGDILKQPALLAAAARARCGPGALAPSEGLLARVARDIGRCVAADTCYSPLSDMAKHAAGLEFEMLLCKRLSDLGVSFWTEGDLRARGYFKTPDVWLHTPLAVKDFETGAWRVVSWIDSKAAFGDDRVHSRQMEEQYSTYTNRYGSGLVIYWFGCLDGLSAKDAQVMVLDGFPERAHVRALAGSQASSATAQAPGGV